MLLPSCLGIAEGFQVQSAARGTSAENTQDMLRSGTRLRHRPSRNDIDHDADTRSIRSEISSQSIPAV